MLYLGYHGCGRIGALREAFYVHFSWFFFFFFSPKLWLPFQVLLTHSCQVLHCNFCCKMDAPAASMSTQAMGNCMLSSDEQKGRHVGVAPADVHSAWVARPGLCARPAKFTLTRANRVLQLGTIWNVLNLKGLSVQSRPPSYHIQLARP